MAILTWNFIFDCKTAEKAEKQFQKVINISGLPFETIAVNKDTSGFQVKATTAIAETEHSKIIVEALRQVHKVALRWYVGYLEYNEGKVTFEGTASNSETSHPFCVPGLHFVGFGLNLE